MAGRPSLPDLATVTSLALVAYAASNILHEGVGHGGACIALGGRPLVLSSIHFECGDDALSALARRGVAAAGTLVNFLAGGVALIALKAIAPARKPHTAYVLWLFTTLNLLMGAGYFLFSGVGNIGDWAAVAAGTVSPRIWRPSMAVFGGALYFFFARRSATWLRRFVGSDDLSTARSRRLTVPAYVGPVLIAISAAAASFGGASGLLWLTRFLRDGAGTEAPVRLDRSYGWIIAGCIVSLIFIAILGPGVRLDR